LSLSLAALISPFFLGFHPPPPPGRFTLGYFLADYRFRTIPDLSASGFYEVRTPQGFVGQSKNPGFLCIQKSGGLSVTAIPTRNCQIRSGFRGEPQWGWPILRSICKFYEVLSSRIAISSLIWLGSGFCFFLLAAVSLATPPWFFWFFMV
jgi:hypothetical protein